MIGGVSEFEVSRRTSSASAPAVRVFLESRYRKLMRGLPQTTFFCPVCKGHRRRCKKCERCAGRGRLSEDSVQELIARRVLPAFRARAGKFHGAGREDVDVLMLGRGRPFVYEIVGPRRLDVDLAALRDAIHAGCGDRIQIEPLRVVTRQRVPYWKEARFDKIYRARIRLGADVDLDRLRPLLGRRLEIRQRTPQRVAHRRADLDRERELTVLQLHRIAAAEVGIEVRCAHGTYVKEWISGDGGRTRPSLADLLGVESDCIELDVLEILDSPAAASGGGGED